MNEQRRMKQAYADEIKIDRIQRRDARLTAAAPDLYAALKAMVSHANDPERYFQAVSDAVAAIAKVEGDDS